MPEQACVQIAENVDKNIQTAPKAGNNLSQAFIALLRTVYSPEEAEVVQHLLKNLEEVADAILDPLIAKGFNPSKSRSRCP